MRLPCGARRARRSACRRDGKNNRVSGDWNQKLECSAKQIELQPGRLASTHETPIGKLATGAFHGQALLA
jgi:hypothetical protein